jgi:hypothetical protein
MKKEATPKCKGLKTKTSDEKRGNSKTQGAQTERHTTKKEITLKKQGAKRKNP